MPLVPYIPKPLPDEILGSWLARISFHNSKGTWSAILMECGFTERKSKPFFDLVDYNENTEKLFSMLGTCYEDVLQELTSLPYWLAFAASNDSIMLPGTKKTKAPLNVRGHKIDRLSLLGLKRKHGKATSPVFCVRCLTEDQERHGEAYWHRSHQLPNVFFCPIHECELHDRCPQCSKRVLPSLRGLMPLPKQTCDCGCQFGSVALVGMPNRAHIEFAKLSAAALEVKEPTWHRADVIDQFKRWFKVDLKQQHVTYIALLKSAFSSIPDPLDKTNELNVSTSMMVKGRKLCFRTSPSVSSSPEFCALLVAMGKNLTEAISAFKNIKSDVKNGTFRRVRPSKLLKLKNGASKKPNYERERVQIKRALLLSKAFHETFLNSDLPTTITGVKLGHSVGLSHEQASSVIASHEFLRESIRKANSGLPERRIMWAVSTLRSKGEKLTKSAVWEVAQLDKRTKSSKKLWDSFSINEGRLEFISVIDTPSTKTTSAKKDIFS
jgi:hypothetical protein